MIDPSHVRVEKRDFIAALSGITPASHRSALSPAGPLSSVAAPLLLGHLQSAIAQLHRVFPPAAACMRSSSNGTAPSRSTHASSIARKSAGGWSIAAALAMQRPRLLVCGPEGTGQSHLGAALLYAVEGLPVHSIGLPALLSNASARSPEEGLVQAVAEARRAAPAVLYLPHLQSWWDTAPGSLRSTFWAILSDLPPDLPLLLLATANVPSGELDPEAAALFGGPGGEGIYSTALPTHGQRVEFFEPLATALIVPPTTSDEDDPNALGTNDANAAPPLPIAPEALAAEEEAKRLAKTAAERKLYEEDQRTLRALRMILRSILTSLLNNKRYKLFWEPMEPDQDPEYWQVVSSPMDLTTLLDRVDRRKYGTPAQFLADASCIQKGEREYWGEEPSTEGLRNISMACALEDDLRAAVESSVPRELNDKLERIMAAGGPSPPPEGFFQSLGLAVDGSLPQRSNRDGHHQHIRRQQSGRYDTDDGDGGSGRRASRLAGDVVDAIILHEDPEAQLRRIRAQKREQQQQQKMRHRVHGRDNGDSKEEINDDYDNNNNNNGEDGTAAIGTAVETVGVDGREAPRPTATIARPGTAAATTRDHHARVLSSSTRTNVVARGDARGKGGADAAEVQPSIDGVPAQEATALTALTGAAHGTCDGNNNTNNIDDTKIEAHGRQQDKKRSATNTMDGVAVASTSGDDQRRVSDAEKKEIRAVQEDLAKKTGGLSLDQLEQVYARVGRIAWERRKESDRRSVIHAAMHSLEEAVVSYHP